MRSILSAIRFLTVVRVPGEPADPGKAAAWFPLVGAALGAVGAAVFIGAQRIVPLPIAALATIAFWCAITGLLHEDGLADVADAIRAGRSRERMLAILKDSRIGTFGAAAVLLSVLARWEALQYVPAPRQIEAIIASQAVPRAGMVALAWIARPVGEGLGHHLASTLTSASALAAIAQGIVAALLCSPRAGPAILIGTFAIVVASRDWFHSRIGGVNGDCLGFTEQILEVFVLALFTCASCV